MRFLGHCVLQEHFPLKEGKSIYSSGLLCPVECIASVFVGSPLF